MMNESPTGRRLSSPTVVRRLLHEAGVRPRRSLGQNFLIDANVLRIIEEASSPSPFDTVIEVGAGLGALTQVLLERGCRVYALESDPRLCEILERELGRRENLVLLNEDAARFDFSSLQGPESRGGFKMVSNLPYGIAATLLIDCLYRYPRITDYTVMVQREVAERLTAPPGSKEYSAFTVKARTLADVARVADVSRNCFYPKPEIDSRIMRLLRKTEPSEDMGDFDALVTAAFGQRRKKLVNALSSAGGLGLEAEAVMNALTSLGINPGSRAEDLAPESFVSLSRLLGGVSRRG